MKYIFLIIIAAIVIAVIIKKKKKAKIKSVITKPKGKIAQIRSLSKQLSNGTYTKTGLSAVREIKAASYEELFVRQALFIRDMEFEISSPAPISLETPEFRNMSENQIKTYIAWRNALQSGKTTKTDIAYAYLYCFELINNIYAISDIEIIERLISFWKEYSLLDKSIDKSLKQWIKDFYIVKSPNIPYERLEGLLGLARDDINEISSYKYLNSRLMATEYKPLFLKTIRHCFERLKGYKGLDIDSVLADRSEETSEKWKPFKNAVYWDNIRTADTIVSTIPDERYIYTSKTNSWQLIKSDAASNRYSEDIGYIIKLIENSFRDAVGYKYKLKPSLDEVTLDEIKTKEFSDFIYSCVWECVSLKNKSSICIDESKFSEIRESAEKLEEILVTEDERVHETVEIVPEAKVGAGFDGLIASLSETEKMILNAIISSPESVNDIAVKEGFMPEIIYESINARALESISDNIINSDGDLPFIYEDYIEEIKQSL